MKIDISVKLIWQIATHEAIAGEFEFIEPSHFFNAILKFAGKRLKNPSASPSSERRGRANHSALPRWRRASPRVK